MSYVFVGWRVVDPGHEVFRVKVDQPQSLEGEGVLFEEREDAVADAVQALTKVCKNSSFAPPSAYHWISDTNAFARYPGHTPKYRVSSFEVVEEGDGKIVAKVKHDFQHTDTVMTSDTILVDGKEYVHIMKEPITTDWELLKTGVGKDEKVFITKLAVWVEEVVFEVR